MEGEGRATCMRICVAQTRPVRGDIESNIDGHKKLIDLSVAHGAAAIVFPELSMTGYEPELSNELATNQDDARFDAFQKIADDRSLTIGVGVPTKNGERVYISTVIFRPRGSRQTYSKRYLHPDEEKFFTAGQTFAGAISDSVNVALAI